MYCEHTEMTLLSLPLPGGVRCRPGGVQCRPGGVCEWSKVWPTAATADCRHTGGGGSGVCQAVPTTSVVPTYRVATATSPSSC